MRVLGIFIFICLSTWANAQTYPSKPIHLIVGYPPGGSGDFTTRIIGDELAKELGVAVVVENKPGAGGSIASEFVAKSAPDGYTLLNQGNHQINKSLYKSLGYEEKDFIPVSRVANGATVLVVNNDTPFKSLRELIAYAKANPGKLFNAAAGFGSAPHIAACAFEAAAGIKLTSVQYKGGGPAMTDLLGGQIPMLFSSLGPSVGAVKSGKIRALAVTSLARSGAFPDVPTMDELGIKGFESTAWYGLLGPAGLPPEVSSRLSQALLKAGEDKNLREQINATGCDVDFLSPAQTVDKIKADSVKWGRVIKEANIKVD